MTTMTFAGWDIEEEEEVQVNLQFSIKTKYKDDFHKTREKESTGDCFVIAMFVSLVWACLAYMKNLS